MARTKPPSFDFFPDDFIAGTYHLPAEAVGIYVRLLCYQWNNGSIPSDENELARVAGVDAAAMRPHMRTVMLKFMPDGCGGLKNARLEREREHKLAVIEKSKSAADSRWTKEKARKAAEAASKLGCGGNADAHADAYAVAMRTDMPPTSNVLLPTSIGYSNIDTLPEWLKKDWQRWLDFQFAKTGQRMPETQADAVIMDLLRRGETKALRDIEFSIRIGAKNICHDDGGQGLLKPGSGQAAGPQGGRKLTNAEKTLKLIEEMKNGSI